MTFRVKFVTDPSNSGPRQPGFVNRHSHRMLQWPFPWPQRKELQKGEAYLWLDGEQ